MHYCIGRLGFTPVENIDGIFEKLSQNSIVDVDDRFQICKLLIANEGKEEKQFLFRDLNSLINFLHSRVNKYPKEKYRDRMFFSSVLFQSVIDMAALKRDLGQNT